jgi:hypothetical protein
MRGGHILEAGRGQAPFVPIPQSAFLRKLEPGHPLAPTSDMFSAALARQYNYANKNFDFNNGPGGYSGIGVNSPTLSAAVTGFATTVSWSSFSNSVFVVDSSVPYTMQKVWMVAFEPKHEGLRPTEENPTEENPYTENIQELFSEVPIPNPDLCLWPDTEELWDTNKLEKVSALPGRKRLTAIGTDGQIVIVDRINNRLFEIFRFGQFREDQPWGPKKGDWKFSNGGAHDLSTYNGLAYNDQGYVSASGVSQVALQISFQDLIEVLRGGKIKHALGTAIAVRRTDHVPPAISNDSSSNQFPTYKNEAGATVPNPAYKTLGYPSAAREEEGEAGLREGYADAVPEGAMFRIDGDAEFGDFPGLPGGPLEREIFEAMRDFGLFVRDGGGTNCTLTLEDYHSLGSPYSYAKVNPLAGSGLPKVAERVNNVLPTSWTDSTLPVMTELLAGTSSVVYGLFEKCAGSLQQIETFSS